MITNYETNKVYIAKGLASPSYARAAYSLLTALHNSQIKWEMLPLTQSPLHIWARDYMPVQIEKNKFIRFRYEPDYLEHYPEYKPQVDDILEKLGIEVYRSSINIDGGNIISCDNRVILTDKIFKENPQYSRRKLIDELTELFNAEPVLIPWDRYEEYGHSDGTVRYIGEQKVLLNHYFDFDKSLRKKYLKALTAHFDVEELHYGGHTNNSWAYINFLHTGNHIFVPMLDEKHDSTAFAQIEAVFPQCICHPIYNSKGIVKEGGALNCSSWNIMTDSATQNDKCDLPDVHKNIMIT